jgi:hypothetical protein
MGIKNILEADQRNNCFLKIVEAGDGGRHEHFFF